MTDAAPPAPAPAAPAPAPAPEPKKRILWTAVVVGVAVLGVLLVLYAWKPGKRKGA